jgi:hypothetical protein
MCMDQSNPDAFIQVLSFPFKIWGRYRNEFDCWAGESFLNVILVIESFAADPSPHLSLNWH